METINVENYKEERFGTAIALGNFDGVHLGHGEIISSMVKRSKEMQIKPSILLFNNHTRGILDGKQPELLTINEQKREILKNLGVEIIYMIEFNDALMKLSPEEFVQTILVDKLNVKSVTVGFDYRFGHKASGNVELLKELGNKYKFHVSIVEPIFDNKNIISSTRIRKLIRDGDIQLANQMLGRNFSILGEVISGKKRGKGLGFPTANIEKSREQIMPKSGIYLTEIIINNRKRLSVTSIGTNPTFNDNETRIETYILDFDKNIYGELVILEFIKYLRAEKKFDNINELKAQIQEDVDLAKSIY